MIACVSWMLSPGAQPSAPAWGNSKASWKGAVQVKAGVVEADEEEQLVV
jgi:hypothetical protein